MCHEIGVGRTTLEDLWPETYPDFKLALEMARIASQNWWESTGRDGMLKKNIDSSIWSRSMAARFPKDWRESKLLGSDPENPLPSNTIDVSQLSDAAKRELAKLKI